MIRLTWIIFLFLPLAVFSQGSIGSLTGDESVFYAQTKQVNQFFMRFNGEEDIRGNAVIPAIRLTVTRKCAKSF